MTSNGPCLFLLNDHVNFQSFVVSHKIAQDSSDDDEARTLLASARTVAPIEAKKGSQKAAFEAATAGDVSCAPKRILTKTSASGVTPKAMKTVKAKAKKTVKGSAMKAKKPAIVSGGGIYIVCR